MFLIFRRISTLVCCMRLVSSSLWVRAAECGKNSFSAFSNFLELFFLSGLFGYKNFLFHFLVHFATLAALKTQPYDLLRWSAAYFRCLSEDEMPPVKPRYEHENVFGCLTRGYLKVLMNQVRIGTGQRTNAALCCYNMLSEDEIWVMSPHISHRKHSTAMSDFAGPLTKPLENTWNFSTSSRREANKIKKHYKFL